MGPNGFPVGVIKFIVKPENSHYSASVYPRWDLNPLIGATADPEGWL